MSIAKGILLGIAAFLASILLVIPREDGGSPPNITVLMAAIIGVLVAIAVALPN
jgi:hypothetical protein